MAITSKMTIETSDVTRGMQKVKQDAKQTVQEVSKVGKTSGNEMDQVAGKIHAAGSSLKDFGSAFQQSGSKIAGIASTVLAVVTAIVNQFKNVKNMLKSIDEIEANMTKHAAEEVSYVRNERVKVANSTASKIAEIIKFTEKDSLSREEQAQLNILKRDVQQGLEFLNLQDDVKIMNKDGDLLSPIDLAKNEAKVRKFQKRETIDDLTSQQSDLNKEETRLKGELEDLVDKSGIEMAWDAVLSTIKIFGDPAKEYIDDIKRIEEQLHQVSMKQKAVSSQLRTVKQSTPATDTLALHQGRQFDLKQQKDKEAKDKADAKIIATLNAEKDEEIARELDPFEQKRLQIEKERDELYKKYVNEGVDEGVAKRTADVVTWRKLRDLNKEREKKDNALSNSLKDKPSEQILTNDLIKQGAGLGIQTTDYSRMTMDLVKQIKEQMNKMLPYMAKVSNKI